MVKKFTAKMNDREIESSITFLKLTKDGNFTEVPPTVLSHARMDELRQPDYSDEEVCCFTYTD